MRSFMGILSVNDNFQKPWSILWGATGLLTSVLRPSTFLRQGSAPLVDLSNPSSVMNARSCSVDPARKHRFSLATVEENDRGDSEETL